MLTHARDDTIYQPSHCGKEIAEQQVARICEHAQLLRCRANRLDRCSVAFVLADPPAYHEASHSHGYTSPQHGGPVRKKSTRHSTVWR